MAGRRLWHRRAVRLHLPTPNLRAGGEGRDGEAWRHMAAWRRHGGGGRAAAARAWRHGGGGARRGRSSGARSQTAACGRRGAGGPAAAAQLRGSACGGGERFKRKRYRTGETSPGMRSVGGRQGWAQRAGRAGRSRVRGECCLVVPRAGDEKVGVRRPVEAGDAVGGGVLDLDVVVGVVACAGAERHSAGSDRSSARQPVWAARDKYTRFSTRRI